MGTLGPRWPALISPPCPSSRSRLPHLRTASRLMLTHTPPRRPHLPPPLLAGFSATAACALGERPAGRVVPGDPPLSPDWLAETATREAGGRERARKGNKGWGGEGGGGDGLVRQESTEAAALALGRDTIRRARQTKRGQIRGGASTEQCKHRPTGGRAGMMCRSCPEAAMPGGCDQAKGDIASGAGGRGGGARELGGQWAQELPARGHREGCDGASVVVKQTREIRNFSVKKALLRKRKRKRREVRTTRARFHHSHPARAGFSLVTLLSGLRRQYRMGALALRGPRRPGSEGQWPRKLRQGDGGQTALPGVAETHDRAEASQTAALRGDGASGCSNRLTARGILYSVLLYAVLSLLGWEIRGTGSTW